MLLLYFNSDLGWVVVLVVVLVVVVCVCEGRGNITLPDGFLIITLKR